MSAPTHTERVQRLLTNISEQVKDWDEEELGSASGAAVEFFEPVADWQALLAEVRRLNTEVLEWMLACGQRDEDMDKDVLTVVRERDEARAEIGRLREEIDQHVPCSECIDEREESEAESNRLRKALRSIAGKQRPSGAYCQRVAQATLDRTALPSEDRP